ncbi:MAG: hypothetical protein DLD55_02445 [candidate division SR1 bacterium]|nr:MAG: hypothetical protein DLD55_02445 [candidate division SR1 bacterium]
MSRNFYFFILISMNYRYLFLALFMATSVSIGLQTAAACQDIRFPNGKSFCFDIHKLSTERFEAKVSSSQINSADLSCKLTLPNANSIVLPGCEGIFNYAGADGKVTLRADSGDYWYEFISNYDFRNGHFGVSPSAPSPDTNNAYSPELVSVSTERPQKDQWIDVILRIRKNGNYANYSGKVKFRVEEYINGARRSPESSTYELERTEYYFSSYESYEKRLDRFLKFKKEGQFRLYLELENGNSTSRDFSVYVPSSDALATYSPEWLNVSDSSPDQYEAVDLSLRIKKENTISHYQGGVDFRVEQYKNGRRETASYYDYTLDKTHYYFSSSEQGEVKFKNFITFKVDGEFRVIAQLRGSNTASATQSFSVRRSGVLATYSPEWFNVSDSSPDQYEAVDLSLRVKRENTSSHYQGGVDFRVEQYKNGRRETASYYDYTLDKTHYYFSSSEQGEVRFKNFITFKVDGDFRIIAQLRGFSSASATQSFSVRRNAPSQPSPRYRAESFSIARLYPTFPREYERIDITIKALDRYGNKVNDYQGRIQFLVEEYRSGGWRSANSSDYQLAYFTRDFSRSDYGEKTFDDVIRFVRIGTFRIKVIDQDRNGLYATREITVQHSSSPRWQQDRSGYLYFTNKELGKIRAVSHLRNDVIASLERDYPRLRRDSYRKNLSDNFYAAMQDILRDNTYARFKNRQEFYTGFQEWFSYTIRTR